jgi:O-antigen/teichoic acid export membrane protein
VKIASSTWRLADNLVSGYAYLAFAAVVMVVLVPVYVQALGGTRWGVVAWCLTVQGVLFGLDAALGPLLLRDVARAGDRDRVQATYARFLRLYGWVAAVVFVAGQLVLAGLDIADATSPTLLWALRLALLQFLFQFANNAAIGVWHGLQRQRTANLRLAGFAVLKHALALWLVLGWRATPAAYFLPFVAVSLVEFVLNRRRVLRESVAVSAVHAAGDASRNIPAFAAAACIGLLSGHIDRLYLSFQLPVTEYGVYFLLGTVLLAVLHLQMPLGRVFLPRMALTDSPAATARAMLRIALPLLVLPCLVLALLAEVVLRLWLHDDAIATTGAPALRLMLIAAAMMVLFAPTSALLLRQQRWRSIATISLTMLLAQCLVLLLLTPTLGMQAGAWAWLAAASVQLAFAWPIWRGAHPAWRWP